MSPIDKPLMWLRGEIKTPPFSPPARLEAGYAARGSRSMTVRKEKRLRLTAKGWKIGSTREFLKLAPEETAYIELKLRLASNLRERRQRRSLTQGDLAKRLKSSQSRVAKMEAGHPSVSLDLLFRSLFALGASPLELSRIVSSRSPVSAA